MDYPNSGSLWPAKNRTNEKSPNVTGSIKMERALLKDLLAASDDLLIEISLAGWTKEWQGKKYVALKASGPYKKREPAPADDDSSDIPF